MKPLARAMAVVLCVLAIATACLAQSGAPPATSVVEGKVVHEPGGEPIRKVVVRLLPTNAATRSTSSAAEESSQQEGEAMDFISAFAEGGVGDERQQFFATTDVQGHFRVEKVPAGNYLVAISRDGYVPTEIKPDGIILTVTEGQNVSDLTYKMATAGLIIGKIVDAEGDPVAGVTVQAIPKNGPRSQLNGVLSTFISGTGGALHLPGIASTNDLGEYRIPSLRSGQYVVLARPQSNLAPPPSPDGKPHPGEQLLYAATYYPGVLEEKQATAVQVTSGATATIDFTLQVHHAYRVAGTVGGLINPKGSYIILMSSDNRPQQQALGEGGKFDFPSLEPGKYFAQVLSPEPGREEGSGMLSVSTPIVVSNSDLVDLVLQPLPHSKVTGRCRAETQDPVEWKLMSIMLMPVSETGEGASEKDIFELTRRTSSGPIHDDGTFEILDVAPGRYQVAILSDSDKYRDWYLKSLLFAGQEVVDTGFVVNSDISLDVAVSPKGASIGGKVLDGDGKPIPNVSVLTVPGSGKLGRPDAYQTARTDANGGFSLRGMNPGDFSVIGLADFQGDAHSPEFYQKYAGQGTSVTLEEGDKKTITLKLASDAAKP